jgi:peptidyl-prolyl cis-trans isomerase C
MLSIAMRCTSLPQILLQTALVLSLATGCPKAGPGPAGAPAKAKDTSAVAATIGGDALTVDELQSRLNEQSPFVRARYAEADKRKEFLDSQVRFEVLAAEARGRGFDRDPEVDDAIKKMIVQKLTREEFDTRVKLADVTDAETLAYFNAHKDDYQKPAMARGTILVVTDSAEGKQAIATAMTKLTAKKAIPGDNRGIFRELVTTYSIDDTTKRDGGDLRYLDQAELERRYGAEAAQWMFASEIAGALSPVFTHNGRLMLLERTSIRKAISRGYDQVKNQVKNVVFRDKRAAAFDTFVDTLKQKYTVTTSPEVLPQLKIDPIAPGATDDGHGHGGMPPGHGLGDGAGDDGAVDPTK